LKIGTYRQAAVATAKKHVENPVKIASPWKPSTIVEQINAWQCTHSMHTHRNSYTRSSGMPTGLTEDLVLQYLHNSIQWHTFGELEKIVGLRRDQYAEGKSSSREKRTLTETDINLTALKRRRIEDGERSRPINAHG
jgi:hypothetical protein